MAEFTSANPFTPKVTVIRYHNSTFEARIHLPGVVATLVDVVPHENFILVNGSLGPRVHTDAEGRPGTLIFTDQPCGVFGRDIPVNLTAGTKLAVLATYQDCDDHVIRYTLHNCIVPRANCADIGNDATAATAVIAHGGCPCPPDLKGSCGCGVATGVPRPAYSLGGIVSCANAALAPPTADAAALPTLPAAPVAPALSTASALHAVPTPPTAPAAGTKDPLPNCIVPSVKSNAAPAPPTAPPDSAASAAPAAPTLRVPPAASTPRVPPAASTPSVPPNASTPRVPTSRVPPAASTPRVPTPSIPFTASTPRVPTSRIPPTASTPCIPPAAPPAPTAPASPTAPSQPCGVFGCDIHVNFEA